MRDLKYGLGIEVAMPPAAAEAAIRASLAEEGFGILTEIDVAATLSDKLGVERAPYKILGACNPALANRALGVDEHIGLLLPCNVIVYEKGDGTAVEAMEPALMGSLTGQDDMEPIAAEARERLIRALRRVEGGSASG